MNRTVYPLIFLSCVLSVSSMAVTNPGGQTAGQTLYPSMAPLEKYLSASPSAEIALARSAGPASVADKAEIRVLSAHGYDTPVKGTNGFVCYVARAWDNDVDSADFWNPRLRGPMCLNPAAVRSYLPIYLQRTQWVLSGVSRTEILNRTKAAIAAKQITTPEAGSMAFMLSKDGYLGDTAAGPWHPHVMFWCPPATSAEWGADLPGSPVLSNPSNTLPLTLFFVPVPRWSDGTLATYSR